MGCRIRIAPAGVHPTRDDLPCPTIGDDQRRERELASSDVVGGKPDGGPGVLLDACHRSSVLQRR
jgi:hypothetical protein